MLREIIRFEIKYHLKGLVFYVCLILFFLLAFGAVTSESVRIGGSIGNVNRNAPFVIMQRSPRCIDGGQRVVMDVVVLRSRVA